MLLSILILFITQLILPAYFIYSLWRGQVDNSGNSSKPHLHIHAVRADSASVLEGKGLPILFEGDFPVRNTVLVG